MYVLGAGISMTRIKDEISMVKVSGPCFGKSQGNSNLLGPRVGLDSPSLISVSRIDRSDCHDRANCLRR